MSEFPKLDQPLRRMRRLRLCVLVSHPIQYHASVWRALAERPELDVTVLFASSRKKEGTFDPEFGLNVEWDRPLLDGYDYRFFDNFSPWEAEDGALRFLNPGLLKAVAAMEYDGLFLHGFHYAEYMVAMLMAKLRSKKVVMRTISHNLGRPDSVKYRIRNLLYYLMFSVPDRLIGIGTANRAYFGAAGQASRRLVWAPHVVDSAWWESERRRLEPSREDLKRKFGFLPQQPVMLFCGKLVPKKRPELAVEAFLQSKMAETWGLLVVGEGALRPQLEEMARSNPEAKICFAGFRNQSELPECYTMADALVLPSDFQETWGLVVNEALIFGNAIIVSDRVGCAEDLVRGRTGEVVPADDLDALIEVFDRWSSDSEIWKNFQKAARSVIAGYTPGKLAERIASVFTQLLR